jgi:hypothetical protein
MTDESYPYDTPVQNGKNANLSTAVKREVERRPAAFSQTDNKTHQAWAKLSVKKPMASAVMHQLVSLLPRNKQAIVISHTLLAKMIEVNPRTVQRAIKDLEAASYIQVVSLGKGSTNAYVLNRRVAWTGVRHKMQYASFDAQVVANIEDQIATILDDSPELKKLPTITPPDIAVPHGEYDEGQMQLDGIQPLTIETKPD